MTTSGKQDGVTGARQKIANTRVQSPRSFIYTTYLNVAAKATPGAGQMRRHGHGCSQPEARYFAHAGLSNADYQQYRI